MQAPIIPLKVADSDRSFNTNLASKLINIALIALGGLVLAGWAFNITVFKSLLPNLAPMTPNSAVSFVLFGIGIWLAQIGHANRAKWMIYGCAATILLIGGLTVAEYLFGWNLGIDEILVKGAGAFPTGRMSEAGALGFVLLGTSLFLLMRTHWYRLLQFLALLVLGVGLLSFIGYLFSVSELFAVSVFNVIALYSTLAFCAAALLLILITGHEGFIAVITQKNLGGLMARRLLPATFLVPLIIGWFCLQGQYRGYYGTEFGLSLFVVSDIIVLTVVVWLTARVLNQTDVKHQRSTAQLERYARRMEILHQIDLGLIGGGSVETLVEETIKHIREIIPCQRASVSVIDPKTGEGVIFALDVDGDTQLSKGYRFPLPVDLLEGYDERHLQIVEDFHLLEESHPRFKQALTEGLVCGMNVLLMDQEQPIGSLWLMADTPGFFIPEYQDIAVEIASQFAIAVKQMRLSETIQKSNVSLERYARRMEILHNIDRGIIGSHDTQELAEITFKELRQLIPCQRIGLNILDELTQELVVYAVNSDQASLSINRTALLPAMLEGFDEINHSRLIEDLRLVQDQVPLASAYLEQGFLTLFQILLTQNSVVQGIVTFSSNTPGFFTPEYREIAIEVSNQIAIAIRQMRLSQSLQSANEKLEQRVIERTAQLNASKDQLEGILNNSSDAILLTDDKLAIQRANPAYERLLASPAQDLTGQSLLDIIYEDDIPKLTTSVQNALSGRDHNEIEVRALRSDGSVVEVELNLGNIEGDGFVSNIHDITARKQYERQMLYQAGIQNAVADAVIVTDLEYRIQSWNKAAERMYGWRGEEVMGKVVESLLQTQFQSQQTVDEVAQIFIEQGYWSGEVTQRRKDGSRIYILSSTALMKDAEGIPFGVLAVNHDITQRKQAEQALQTALKHEKEAGELKTRFISIASHEFRTPLTTILLTTESLKYYRHKLQSEQIDQKLEKIHQQVTHMTAILEDVMQSAKMQDKRIDFKPTLENFDAICRDIIEEFAARPEYANRIQYRSDMPDLKSLFDSRLMRQVFINLLSNALKYSPNDKPVQINLAQKDQNIVLEISDQGIGIPEADLKHIFEPFHRAQNVGDISGTGLGMSISKKAVEMHGGSISVTSEPNVGTTFTVTIPIQ